MLKIVILEDYNEETEEQMKPFLCSSIGLSVLNHLTSLKIQCTRWQPLWPNGLTSMGIVVGPPTFPFRCNLTTSSICCQLIQLIIHTQHPLKVFKLILELRCFKVQFIVNKEQRNRAFCFSKVKTLKLGFINTQLMTNSGKWEVNC